MTKEAPYEYLFLLFSASTWPVFQSIIVFKSRKGEIMASEPHRFSGVKISGKFRIMKK